MLKLIYSGANQLQLGMLQMQKGNIKEAEKYIRQALRSGYLIRKTKLLHGYSFHQS